ncbi:MAG TPA: thiamine phosphate synthase [Candidatus Limnocylindria bacterium]|jgi:thiamine-phosphate pyrophosphorylase|nr:thiamine phosphate synthase [Candidatus Limnocylindria bacterium]
MGLKPFKDCHLYAFIDSAYLDGRAPDELARELCEGGADIIQLRAKDRPANDLLRWAELVRPITRAARVWLVINDYPEVAAQTQSDCLHLGQEDFFDAGFTTAAEVAQGRFALGLSTHTPEQCLRAVAAGPDYVAIGPVFPTATKPGRQAVTLDYVRWAAKNVTLPWFAIGGITLDNVEQVREAGATRICVVGAILRASNISRACREFRQRITLGQ